MKIDNFVILYNAAQIISSAYVVKEVSFLLGLVLQISLVKNVIPGICLDLFYNPYEVIFRHVEYYGFHLDIISSALKSITQTHL